MTCNMTFKFLPFSYVSYVKYLSVMWFDLETLKERKKVKPKPHIGMTTCHFHILKIQNVELETS